jgi:hypothetical protein
VIVAVNRKNHITIEMEALKRISEYDLLEVQEQKEEEQRQFSWLNHTLLIRCTVCGRYSQIYSALYGWKKIDYHLQSSDYPRVVCPGRGTFVASLPFTTEACSRCGCLISPGVKLHSFYTPTGREVICGE